jgi:hypothetical protein
MLPCIRSSDQRLGAIHTGCLMKDGIGTHSEHYVIRIDGRVKSHHRRFVDALREGLQLKDQFPQHDIKVRAMRAHGEQRAALH